VLLAPFSALISTLPQDHMEAIQIDLEKPLINSIRIGRLAQQVKYEGISSLCFCCGRLRYKQENCCY